MPQVYRGKKPILYIYGLSMDINWNNSIYGEALLAEYIIENNLSYVRRD